MTKNDGLVMLKSACFWLSLQIVLLFALYFGPSPKYLVLLFYEGLFLLAWIDCYTSLLPDCLTLSLLWLGLIANCFYHFANLQDAIWGAVIGYLSLWLIYQIHYCFTKRPGLGYGDFKLCAAIGAWLGWQALPEVLLLSSVISMGWFAWRWLKTRCSIHTAIPYGPGLAFAGVVLMLTQSFLLKSI